MVAIGVVMRRLDIAGVVVLDHRVVRTAMGVPSLAATRVAETQRLPQHHEECHEDRERGREPAHLAGL